MKSEARQTQIEAELELVGKVLNYSYADGAALRVVFEKESMYWEGVDGPLKDMRGQNHGLRMSKIADGIYFCSWVADFGGEESIVYNLNEMSVFAHVFMSADMVFQIDGQIANFGDSASCIAPDKTPQSDEERRAFYARNNPDRPPLP